VYKAIPSLSNFEIPQAKYGDGPVSITPPTSDSPGSFTYKSLNTFVATKFIEANDNDFKFLHTTLRKLTKENSDSFFVKGFKNGVDDVMSVAKDKKYPTTLFEYLSNIFNKNTK
jgi:hypothetical protein